jgi:hypothetical protein
VRQPGNYRLSCNINALQQTIFLGDPWRPPVDSANWGRKPAPESRLVPAKEAKMELRMRLNVLAAVVSFAFLTAIVLGMF